LFGIKQPLAPPELQTSEMVLDRKALREPIFDELLQNLSTIPFAFNDNPGEWIIEVRDVMTGVTGRLKMVCAPR